MQKLAISLCRLTGISPFLHSSQSPARPAVRLPSNVQLYSRSWAPQAIITGYISLLSPPTSSCQHRSRPLQLPLHFMQQILGMFFNLCIDLVCIVWIPLRLRFSEITVKNLFHNVWSYNRVLQRTTLQKDVWRSITSRQTLSQSNLKSLLYVFFTFRHTDALRIVCCPGSGEHQLSVLENLRKNQSKVRIIFRIHLILWRSLTWQLA